MDFRVNIRSDVPAYVQIENLIQFAVSSGELAPHDQLPTIKQMSEQIGININTVAKAYRDLEIMGFVYTRRGMGVFVSKDAPRKCRTKVYGQNLKKLYALAQEAKAAGIPRKFLNEILRESFAVEAEPYDDVPTNLLSIARKK